MDLPAIDKCKVGKKGGHHMAAILPGEDDGYITLYCELCAAIRRVPASGQLLADRLDDAVAEAGRILGA